MKDLLIRKLPQGQIYQIYIEGGGKVPDELSGKYNKIKYAERSIATYKAQRDKPKREYRKSKVKEDGKNVTKS